MTKFYKQFTLTVLIIFLTKLCISQSERVHYCPDKTENVCGKQNNYDCGSVAPKTLEISKSGGKINFTVVPWHVEIYFFNEYAMKYKKTCGGTIISKKWIITVAHSFWDFGKKQFRDLTKCIVVAGATGLDYYADEDFKTAQKRGLKRLISTYKGVNEPQKDIAVVELATDLEFTDAIHHVCIQFAEVEENSIPSNLIGAFAGHVYSVEKVESEEQQFVITETTSHDECKKELSVNHRPLLGDSIDVVCLSYCLAGIRYYSHGGGFIIVDDVKKRFSLVGIISFGDYDKDCSTDPQQIVITGQAIRSLIENADKDGSFEIQHTNNSAIIAPPTSAFGNFCRLPSNKEHLIVEDLSNNVIATGALIPSNIFVKFKCDINYFLEGELQNVCIDSHWQVEMPACVKYCNKTHLTTKTSSIAQCQYYESQVPCNDRIRAETQAHISCISGFIPPKVYKGYKVHKILTCGSDGKWNYDKFSCIMQCGRLAPKVQEYIGDGSNRADITETPWHVGIYDIYNGATYSYSCGGTIITPNLIISASHCFWDVTNGRLHNTSLFSVVAGKYYREYDSEEEFFPVQKRKIEEIHVQSSFKGSDNNYLDDIAVIKVTTHFEFTDTVRPVCIQFLERGDQDVQTNLTGNFVNWRIKNRQNSTAVLESLSMQTLSYRECGRKIKSQHADYKLPNDKFCLKDNDDVVSTLGIGGGGFVVPSIDSNMKLYFNLIGVASREPPTGGDSTQDRVIVLTNVHYFKSLIAPIKLASEDEF